MLKRPEIYYYHITVLLYYQIQKLKYQRITFVRELEFKEEMVFNKCSLPNIHQGLLLSIGVKCLINCTYIKLDKMVNSQHTNDYN